MDFAEVFTKPFLLTYEGRFNRARYWAFALAYIGVAILLGIVDRVIGSEVGILGLLFALAALYPSICVGIKRWHDRGKSGWWTLIVLIPVIGWIWAFVELGCLKGTDGPNSYGPDPLAPSA